MTDSELAGELIVRMNRLLLDAGPKVRRDIQRLLKKRVDACPETQAHPTIQVTDDEEGGLTFLGFLNGVVGVVPEGPKAGWGFITGTFDLEENIQFFSKTRGTGA